MRKVKLQEVCEIVQGGRHKLSGKHFVESGFPAYGAGGLNGYLETYEFEKPAVVLSSIGARCGKCFYANGKWSSLANTQVFFPNESLVDAKFLWYQLNDESRWIRSGTAQPFIKPSDVKNHLISLPPLSEQKRIAEVLDKADALREKRRLALQKLDMLLQSVFLEMFGDPVKNPKGWKQPQLKEIGKVTTGSTPSSELSNMFGGEIPFVTPSDLERVDKRVSRTLTDEGGEQSRIVRKGSTLVCCIGATIGKVGKAFVPSAFNQQINAIEWNEDVNDDFGFHLLKFYKPIIAALGASTTLPILKKSSFEKIKFPVPPIDLQNKFSEIVKKIESLISKNIDSLEKTETLFQSLQQRAFKGELFSDEPPTVESQEEKVWQQTSLS